MMYWYGHGGAWMWPWMVLGNLLVLAVIVVIVVIVVLFFRALSQRPGAPGGGHGGHGGWGAPPSTGAPGPRSGPEQILAERYARGEIDEEEYERRLATLRGSPPPGRPAQP